MKKSKKSKAGNAFEALFPMAMDLKPHEDRIRAIYRKLEMELHGDALPYLLEGIWAKNLTNAQLVDLTEINRSIYPANSTINRGLWEVRNRLMRRPNATRVSPKDAKRDAWILAMPDPS